MENQNKPKQIGQRLPLWTSGAVANAYATCRISCEDAARTAIAVASAIEDYARKAFVQNGDASGQNNKISYFAKRLSLSDRFRNS